MKRATLIIIMACFFLGVKAYSQLPGPGNGDWLTKWTKLQPAVFDESDPNAWMFGDRMYTGIAYDAIRDVVYVVSPDASAPMIYAFDAETGASVGQLFVDTAVVYGGYNSGKYSLYKIRVDEYGRIFACNLTLRGEPFRVYQWDTDTSRPKLVYEYTGFPSPDLIGTAFDVVGSYYTVNGIRKDSVRIYISTCPPDSGSGHDGELHILAADNRLNKPYDYRLMQIIRNPDSSVAYFGAGVAAVNPLDIQPELYLGSDIYVCAPSGIIYRIRQTHDSSNSPLIQEIMPIDTVPSRFPGSSNGVLAFVQYPGWGSYLFVGRTAPSTFDVLQPNTNTVVDAFGIDTRNKGFHLSSGAYPYGPTPFLGNNIPSLLAGNQHYIAAIDDKVFIKDFSPFEQVYYLLSNNGIGCYVSRAGMLSPVELSAFTAHSDGNAVQLAWTTATETNNYGFDIERSFGAEPSPAWETIGFVEGNGTTTAQQEYSWSEPLTSAHRQLGIIQYRLKQTDFDGTYEYSPVVDVAVGSAATGMTLNQNYPNPFNPTTRIVYQISEPSYISLKVFNIYGAEIALLAKGMKEEGEYAVEFDCTHCPAGIYFYQLIAGGTVIQKKMVLVK